MFSAKSGYEIILEVGVDRIREKSLRQTRRLMELVVDSGFEIRTPTIDAERGGTVTVDVPDGRTVTDELLKRNVLVDFRPGAGIRIAPHFYTKDEELDVVVSEIRDIIAGSASRI
jgi:kynureninase